ncbi:MAG: alpha/beta hydrolase [Beijerinckiaceae bacterium]|nr:alpha/beta hydrolase [Beijerinckiaceae bacterium]
MDLRDRRSGGVPRRTFLSGLAAGLTVAAAPLRAQPQAGVAPLREKGPSVWLDMDQAELDDAYNQIKYAPNMQQIIARYGTASEAARARIGEPKVHAYGEGAAEKLDLFTAKASNAPVHVFVHGGAWRGGEARLYSFLSEMFLAAGVHWIGLDFMTVDDAKGSLTQMTNQVKKALAWVHANASGFGGDPDRIFVSGHSSGAHLAAVAMTTDWRSEFGLAKPPVKGAVLCSGMYDMKPVRLSNRSKYVRFDDAMEEAESAARHIARLNVPLVLAYGTRETPEFQRQTRDFAARLDESGKPATLLRGENYNHFEIIETLGNPYGLLGRAALQQIRTA